MLHRSHVLSANCIPSSNILSTCQGFSWYRVTILIIHMGKLRHGGGSNSPKLQSQDLNPRDVSTAQSRHTPLLTDLSLTFRHFLIFLHWTCNTLINEFFKKINSQGEARAHFPNHHLNISHKTVLPTRPPTTTLKKKTKANPVLGNSAPVFHLDNQVPLFPSQSICLGEGGKSAKHSPQAISTCWFFWPFPGAQRPALAQEQSSD